MAILPVSRLIQKLELKVKHMLDAIFDNLSRFENLSTYIPSLIQLLILIIWIFIIRISKAQYQTSIGLSLFLLLVSLIAQLLTITFLAQTVAEYAFMFLGVGILQLFFMKQDETDELI